MHCVLSPASRLPPKLFDLRRACAPGNVASFWQDVDNSFLGKYFALTCDMKIESESHTHIHKIETWLDFMLPVRGLQANVWSRVAGPISICKHIHTRTQNPAQRFAACSHVLGPRLVARSRSDKIDQHTQTHTRDVARWG
jgi:hypothetical protein